jgi:hypothetical protein
MLGALRLTLTEAAVAMARPQRAGRTWWEIAPWQALLDAIDARRRIYLTAQPVPPQLTMSSDLSALTYPGGGTIVLRGGAAARTSLATLVTRTPAIRVALLRVTVGGSAEELSDRAIAARWAGEQSEPDLLLAALQSNDAVTIASALARLLVAMNPLMRHDPLLVIDLDDHAEQLAGVLTAISLAGAAGSVARRLDDDRTPGLTVTARMSEPAIKGLQPRSQIALMSALVQHMRQGSCLMQQRLPKSCVALPICIRSSALLAHSTNSLPWLMDASLLRGARSVSAWQPQPLIAPIPPPLRSLTHSAQATALTRPLWRSMPIRSA